MPSRRDLLRMTALAALAACTGKKLPSGGPGTPDPALSAAGKAGLQVGGMLPTVSSEAVEGPPVDLADFKSRPMLLNFWASTCEPCKREFPLFKKAIERHSDLTIVGVDVMDRKADAAKFVNDEDATWPSIWDPDGSIAKKFQVRVLPVTYAVGRSFTLVDRIFGEIDDNRLTSMVETIYKS